MSTWRKGKGRKEKKSTKFGLETLFHCLAGDSSGKLAVKREEKKKHETIGTMRSQWPAIANGVGYYWSQWIGGWAPSIGIHYIYVCVLFLFDHNFYFLPQPSYFFINKKPPQFLVRLYGSVQLLIVCPANDTESMRFF
jgi:hypothetical protein